MLMQEERELVAEYGRRMSSEGLSSGTSGNISVFREELGLMAVSPSGLDYFDTQPEDVVVCDLEGNRRDGKRKPSSECGLHAAFYREKAALGCRAVVHTHSDFATALACMGEPLRAVHYLVAAAGTHEVPLAEYATFGTPELAEAAVKACGGSRAVLLANHGLVAWGTDLKGAFRLASNMELLAGLQWRCMCAGKMNVLSPEQVRAAMERFGTYGQAPSAPGSLNTY